MSDLIALAQTPVPTLLVLCGFFLFLLALAGKISTYVELQKVISRLISGILGIALLGSGIGIYVLSARQNMSVNSTASNPTQNSSSPITSTLVPSNASSLVSSDSSSPSFVSTPTPTPTQLQDYVENFENTAAGQTPEFWAMSEDLFVTQRGAEKFLTNSDMSRNKQRLSITNSGLSEDFTLRWTFSQIQGCDQEVTIGSINVFIGSCSVYDIMIYRLGKSEARVDGKLQGKVVNYSIERKGSIVTLKANNTEVLQVRIDDIGNPNTIEYSLESEFRLYRVEISQ